jgi:hypothetical protein
MFVEQAKKQRSCRATTYILCRSYGTRLIIDNLSYKYRVPSGTFRGLSLCQQNLIIWKIKTMEH